MGLRGPTEARLDRCVTLLFLSSSYFQAGRRVLLNHSSLISCAFWIKAKDGFAAKQ